MDIAQDMLDFAPGQRNEFDTMSAAGKPDRTFGLLCVDLFKRMGFHAKLTREDVDGGGYIVAHSRAPYLPEKFIVKCKPYEGSVRVSAVCDLHEVVTLENADRGILVTTGSFTSKANAFAARKSVPSF